MYECITDDTTRCKHMIFPAFRIVIAGKYCIVVSMLKPGDRFKPMTIVYFFIVIVVMECLSHSLATCLCEKSKLWSPIYKARLEMKFLTL